VLAGQHHAPASLTPEKIRTHCTGRWVGSWPGLQNSCDVGSLPAWRQLFAVYLWIKKLLKNPVPCWHGLPSRFLVFFLSFQISVFMVRRNRKISSYNTENKTFPTAFYSTQTATIYLDTRIKGLYVTFLLGYSCVHIWSIAQISQHGKETSLLACAPLDY
jgi:hypothetical protein